MTSFPHLFLKCYPLISTSFAPRCYAVTHYSRTYCSKSVLENTTISYTFSNFTLKLTAVSVA